MKKATRSILSTVLAVSMAATACPVSFAATTSNEVTAREKANAALAAAYTIVDLKKINMPSWQKIFLTATARKW